MSRTSEEPGAVRNRAEVLRVLQEARQVGYTLYYTILYYTGKSVEGLVSGT